MHVLTEHMKVDVPAVKLGMDIYSWRAILSNAS